MSDVEKEIADFLESKLSYIYCDTCKFEESGNCEDCYRKYMNWEASSVFCRNLAKKIMKKIVNKEGEIDGNINL